MQIVIGLMTDHEGKPVWVQVFEGNTADQTTVLDQIRLLRDTLGIRELVFVGDRGMLTHSVIEDMEGEFEQRKVDYEVASRYKSLKTAMQGPGCQGIPLPLPVFHRGCRW